MRTCLLILLSIVFFRVERWTLGCSSRKGSGKCSSIFIPRLNKNVSVRRWKTHYPIIHTPDHRRDVDTQDSVAVLGKRRWWIFRRDKWEGTAYSVRSVLVRSSEPLHGRRGRWPWTSMKHAMANSRTSTLLRYIPTKKYAPQIESNEIIARRGTWSNDCHWEEIHVFIGRGTQTIVDYTLNIILSKFFIRFGRGNERTCRIIILSSLVNIAGESWWYHMISTDTFVYFVQRTRR